MYEYVDEMNNTNTRIISKKLFDAGLRETGIEPRLCFHLFSKADVPEHIRHFKK